MSDPRVIIEKVSVDIIKKPTCNITPLQDIMSHLTHLDAKASVDHTSSKEGSIILGSKLWDEKRTWKRRFLAHC